MDKDTVYKTSATLRTQKTVLTHLPDDFIHTVEDHGVPPHSNRNGVISVRQAICADEQSLRVREDEEAEHTHHVDKVTEVSKEIVITTLPVGVEPDWHKIGQLTAIPQVQVFRVGANQVTADKDIQYTGDEKQLLSQSDRRRLIPLSSQAVDRFSHPSTVFV